MDKKILLVHPEVSRNKYNFNGILENEPLELEYLSAVLKQEGYTPEIFDVPRETVSLEEKLRQCRPDVFYICGRIKQEAFMKEYIRLAKRLDPQVVTIVGGLHVQKNQERFYMPETDYILTTFDVFQVSRIIEGEAPEEIPGLCYREGGQWKCQVAQPFDIRRLPWPDRSYFYSHPGHYNYFELPHCAEVRTAYSCAFRCRFCYRNVLNCGTYTARDIEDVVEEIASIDSEGIYIIDDDFLLDAKRIRRFIDLIKEKGIHKTYVCMGRVDFILKNRQLIRDFAEIGLLYLIVGLEAVEDTYLKQYNKRTKISWNAECVRFTKELGIKIFGMFIVDLDFQKKDFDRLYTWIATRGVKNVAVSIFTPVPGTEIYHDYADKLITEDPGHWDYMHLVCRPEKLSVRKYYFYYYVLLIRLFLLARRQGVYDGIDYRSYILSFLKNMVRGKGAR